MELRHLRYFVTLAEELHFGRAAARLYIVQPALSKQVAALEKELGVELFVRTKRQVEITPAGLALLEDARQILSQVEGARLRAQMSSRGEVGHLEIGFAAPVIFDPMPTMLRAFRREFPSVCLSLRQVHTREVVSGLLSRDLHIVFTRLPVSAVGDLQVQPLVEESVLVALPNDHPFASRESVALGDLAHEDFILISRSEEPEVHDAHIAACVAAGFMPRLAHQVDGTHVAVELVAIGLGICFVPSAMELAAHPGVTYRPLTSPTPRITFGAIWHPDRLEPVLKNFLELEPWRLGRDEESVRPGSASGGSVVGA